MLLSFVWLALHVLFCNESSPIVHRAIISSSTSSVKVWIFCLVSDSILTLRVHSNLMSCNVPERVWPSNLSLFYLFAVYYSWAQMNCALAWRSELRYFSCTWEWHTCTEGWSVIMLKHKTPKRIALKNVTKFASALLKNIYVQRRGWGELRC